VETQTTQGTPNEDDKMFLQIPEYADERRALLEQLDHPLPIESRHGPAVGLAFSGGGIRSATTSLGIVQALTRYDRFFGFDFMSSSSGGGYLACFLRSLFLPGKEREARSTVVSEGDHQSALDDERMSFCYQVEAAANRQAERALALLRQVNAIKPNTKSPLNVRGLRQSAWAWNRASRAFFRWHHRRPKLKPCKTREAAEKPSVQLGEKAKFVEKRLRIVSCRYELAEVAIFSAKLHASKENIEAARSLSAKARRSGERLAASVDDVRQLHQRAKSEPRRKRFAFAKEVLRSAPGNKVVAAEGLLPESTKNDVLRHPVNWLREHGRYLAPGGAMDWATGISLVVRNWLGLMLMIALAFTLFLFFLQLVLWGIDSLLGDERVFTLSDWVNLGEKAQIPIGFKLSVFALAATLCGYLSLSSAIAYMITHRVPYNPLPRRGFWQRPTAKLAGSIALTLGLLTFSLCGALMIFGNLPAPTAGLPESAEFPNKLSLIAFVTLFIATFIGLSLVCFAAYWTSFFTGQHANKAQLLRRWLLEWQSWFNLAFLGFVYLAIVDTIGLYLHDNIRSFDNDGDQSSAGALTAGIMATILQPLGAYIIQKVPSLFGESQNPIVAFLRKRISLLALIVGAALFSVTAVGTSLLVHFAFWEELAWGQVDWEKVGLFGLVVVIFGFFVGSSGNLMNLISLHTFYAARLTRAYLGATNVDRLAWGEDVKRSMDSRHDHIDSYSYFRANLAAPFHLLNVTINDTVSRENLIARDRKGRRGTFEYEGLSIQGGQNTWSGELKDAEWLTVGQLCAISGAAASSGMGRLTSLGSALALSFANVRLGYWWNRGNATLQTEGRRQQDQRVGQAALTAQVKQNLFTTVFPTFASVLNEMQARFPLTDKRIYLSDAGHSENTGAMALLDKGCRTLLVCDNGADPNYEFADLETFIRTARIDENYTIREATRSETANFCGQYRSKTHECFLNMQHDWRSTIGKPGGPAFALLLRARKIEDSVAKGGRNEKDENKATYIVWLIPRIFAHLPPDLVAYSKAFPEFPNHSTADQFFDEAQWESYRRIGYEMIQRLFEDRTALNNFPLVAHRK
jgi:hypothetical protein